MLAKLFRILTKLQYFMYMILSSEILLLMWNIDLSPIIIVTLLCVIGICYNYFTTDGENETETFEPVGFIEKYFHLFCSIIAYINLREESNLKTNLNNFLFIGDCKWLFLKQ